MLNRHALQFGCPVATVAVRALGGGAWEAIGCGQRLTYQCGYDPDVVVRCIAESRWTPASAR